MSCECTQSKSVLVRNSRYGFGICKQLYVSLNQFPALHTVLVSRTTYGVDRGRVDDAGKIHNAKLTSSRSFLMTFTFDTKTMLIT